MEVVELGTKKYPYKVLDSALSEIFLVHSESSNNIIIYVMEESTVYLSRSRYIVSITNVTICTYSTKFEEPRKARLITVEDPSQLTVNLVPTKFNFLSKFQNNSLPILLAQMINDTEVLNSLLLSDGFVKVYNSGVVITNFKIVSDYSSESFNSSFIIPIKTGNSTIRLSNIDFKYKGLILN